MQRGATLLEIAIAIGVCGVLLGIVLSVDSMNHAAKIHNHIAALQTNDSAASTFRIKYGYLPGDLTAAQARMYGYTERYGSAGQGDGNGLIEGCDAHAIRLGCENILFWRDLSQANLIAAHFTEATNRVIDGTPSNFYLRDYLPTSSFRADIQLFLYPLQARNYYYIARIPDIQWNGSFAPTGAFSPSEAYDIDKKMDDGLPATGRVRAMHDPKQVNQGENATATTCVRNSEGMARYQTSADARSCQLSILSGL